jgi:glycosyltransferase involved in cell wall biosynthesis
MWGLREKDRLKLTFKAFFKLALQRKVIFYIQKLHYHSAAPFLLHRIFNRRYIFDYDDYDVDLTVAFIDNRLNRWIFGSSDPQQMLQNIAKRAFFCVASSKYLESFLLQFNPDVVYIPTGVDTSIFKYIDRSDRESPVTFLWNGLIWGEEVLQSALMMLRAFQAVRKSTSEFRLRVVGGGQFMPRFEDALKTDFADLGGNIELQSWVSPDQMPGILASSDAGLLPLFGDSRWIRSKSPTKLFEYMATGLPVVASDVGEVANVIEPGKSGLLASNEDAFARHILSIITDSNLRIMLGKRARERIEQKFSLNFLCEKLYWYLIEKIR